MGFDWKRVLQRYEELEDINHIWLAEMELAIIFGEYELAEYLEDIRYQQKQRTNGFSLNEWREVYDHIQSFGLYKKLRANLLDQQFRQWKNRTKEGGVEA